MSLLSDTIRCLPANNSSHDNLLGHPDRRGGRRRPNYDEYFAGTEPPNPAYRLSVTSFAPTPTGGFTLIWDTLHGVRFIGFFEATPEASGTLQ
jgi:hypothetical protein